MQSLQAIFTAREGLEHCLVMEPSRELEVFLVASASVELGEHFVHAAVFTTEHALKLVFGKLCNGCIGPIGKFDCNGESFRALKIAMSVQQSREEFVQVVPRHPASVEVEGLHANVTGRDFLKDLLAIWNRCDV